MTIWAPRFSQRKRKCSRRPVPSFRPRLEVLEDRVVPALYNHGGPILSSVQVQALYLGAGWSTANILTSQLDGFLNTTVSGATPYLSMLGANNAGFTGVTGVGSVLASATDGVTPVPTGSTDLLDSQIQTDLQADVKSGLLKTPAKNTTLYFVFVQPGTVVDFGNGQTSVNTFLAYHYWFAYNGAEVPYAVVPYHGSAGNAQDAWLNQFDSMTVAASHELAESITDPNGNAWYDRSGNEVGDIVNGSTVYLPGQGGTQYAVQREAAIPGSQYNYLAMTPTGATAGHQTIFGVVRGSLTVNNVAVANPTAATGHTESSASQVVSISTQGVDDFGQPMVDVVFSDHNAYEYHDFPAGNATQTANPGFFPWTNLGPNVKQAVAGQGVSYVLLTNGSLGEYVDPNYTTYSYGYGVNPGARYGVIASNVSLTAGIAAGVDQQGVNAVVYVSGGKSYEWRDVTGHSSAPTSGFIPAAKMVSGHSDANGAVLNAAVQAEALVVADIAAGPIFQATSTAVVGPAPIPGAMPATQQTFVTHFSLPDGGGGRMGDDLASGAAVSPPDMPANVADVPVFGPAFLEAVRQLKDARLMIPSGLWPAVPAKQVAPPAPPPAGQKGSPETKGPEVGRPQSLVMSGLLAVFGFGLVGLTRPPQRPRHLRLGARAAQRP